MRTALFPGSFDPLHNGHVEVIEVCARHFDRVAVAVVANPQKGEPLFTLENREDMVRESLSHLDNVLVRSFSGLVVDIAKDLDASAIVKGLRAVTDFDNELQMAQMNYSLSGIDTIFIPTGSEHSFIASRLIREVSRFGGDVSGLVPSPVTKRLAERFAL